MAVRTGRKQSKKDKRAAAARANLTPRPASLEGKGENSGPPAPPVISSPPAVEKKAAPKAAEIAPAVPSAASAPVAARDKAVSGAVAAESSAVPVQPAAAENKPGSQVPASAATKAPLADQGPAEDKQRAEDTLKIVRSSAETPDAKEEREAIDLKILHHEPFIDEHYNQTYCYALPRNSRSMHVFFEVSSGTKDHLQYRFGQQFLKNNYLVLRVRRVDTGHWWDIEDYIDGKNNYWVGTEPNAEYEVELGYRSKGTKYFERVAVSNRCRTQPEAETRHESQNETREIQVPNYAKEHPVHPNDWRWNLYEYWKRGKAHRGEESGYWALVLHMHLPFVRHLEWDVALEEQWLFEAITSCYAPMLHMFWNLEREKIDFRMTVAISPPLISMLTDPALQLRYRRYLDECLTLASREFQNHKGRPFQHTIQTIIDRLDAAKRVFNAYGGNILNGFRDFQNMEKVEVISCAGTHPILPYYMHYPEIIRGHIQMACRQYQRVFGRWPRGMWLPENAFCPGVDKFLADEGIKWTVCNSTGLTRGNTRVWYGTHRPVITHHGLAMFGIDEDTRAQVWSREAGYPGAAAYKEWYRDLGYDSSWDYLPQYWKVGNCRRNTGLKYYRITGKNVALHEKQPYNPDWARMAVADQAGQFVCHRGAQAYHWRNKYQTKPIAVSAYDAELFGHWWEEGPSWIEMVFRKMAYDQQNVRLVTPGEFLYEQPKHQLLMPGMSTWGSKATFETWMDGRAYRPNCWIYRHLFRLSEQMIKLATERKDAQGIEKRALNQAARELMLAQASDWPFLISMDQSSRYAEVRLIKHIDRAKELMRQVEAKDINAAYLKTIETTDTLLAEDMDFRVFCRG
ncbi:MAG TPA: 1,4-alpha-glucan branching protein domain-containing protein [Planctomycetota bacterium]|jgi:1,4-alpha-glucan branching enzyme